MLAGGDMRDILITYNILGAEKISRLRTLSQRIPDSRWLPTAWPLLMA